MVWSRVSVVGVVWLLVAWGLAAAPEAAERPWLHAKPESVERWQDWRYGMFIHWGPVCLKGTEISWSRKGPRRGHRRGGSGSIPMEVYDNLYKEFNPVRFNADEWVKIARDAGMKYLVFTAKHHAGFSMFDSAQTDYDIMAGPFKRDIVKELADACHKAGLGFGLYYSPRDWYHPAFATDHHQDYLDFYLGQLRELCTNYGSVDIIWFDGLDSPRELWGNVPEKSFEMLRSLQPGIMLNNRGGLPGDFDTPEQRVGGFNRERPWETCMTICRQWSWKPNDRMKSLQECVHTLVRTVGGDGNLLFNVGPMPDGRIEARQVERLRAEGAWLKARAEAFYGTRGGPFKPGRWGASTCRDQRIFVHILDWGNESAVNLPPLPVKIAAARLYPGGGTVDWAQTDDGIRLSVDEAQRDPLDTIVELTVAGDALAISPAAVRWRSTSLAYGGRASASNVYQGMKTQYGPDKALDDDPTTRWATDAGVSECWLQVDLGKPVAVGGTMIDEWAPRIQQFELQCRVGDKWQTCLAGKTVGARRRLSFTPVTGQVFRLKIDRATDGPTLNEWWLLPLGK